MTRLDSSGSWGWSRFEWEMEICARVKSFTEKTGAWKWGKEKIPIYETGAGYSVSINRPLTLTSRTHGPSSRPLQRFCTQVPHCGPTRALSLLANGMPCNVSWKQLSPASRTGDFRLPRVEVPVVWASLFMGRQEGCHLSYTLSWAGSYRDRG